MSLENLNNKHPLYKQKSARWHFLYASYVGGNTYREGAYLRKYWGEDNAPFDAYSARLDVTPLDNHVKTTVDIYRSYLWRNQPKRNFGNMFGNPFIDGFLHDADFNGQGIDSFMKTALDWAMVLGHVWINIDRPAVEAQSAAEEMELGIRAYASMYTPQMVPDWKWEKSPNGQKFISYLKVYEMVSSDMHIIKEWYPDRVVRTVVKVDKLGEYDSVIEQTEVPNALGKVPFICMAPQRSPVNGIGDSILDDVADVQRSIYNKLSELEQTIRMSGHPSLVKTSDTKAVAGAGGIITIPDDLDPGLYPQLLQPSGSVAAILDAIEHDVTTINGMTHLGAIRAIKGSTMSGVALQTERELLNSKLSDLADITEETELKIWALWFEWMEIGRDDDFKIEYYKSFDIKDPAYEITIWQKALETVTDPEYIRYAQKEIAKLTIKDEAVLNSVLQSIDKQPNALGNTDA